MQEEQNTTVKEMQTQPAGKHSICRCTHRQSMPRSTT